MKMENAEEIFHFLEEFSKRKPKTIPQELNEYLAYVARTGDPVYQWTLVKSLFKEKLLNVITDFYETSPGIDIPPYPNVDPFNYDTMKNSLLERLDSFSSAPFTVQRICELLTYPRKQYNRVDKFMRAIEKNILVVSTREPGVQRHIEPENGEPMEPIVNGSDNNSDYNVDVEMEDMSWKESSEPQPPLEPQPSSSDTRISVDDIEARLKAKQDAPMDVQDKLSTQYESVTPPELNVTTDEQMTESKPEMESDQPPPSPVIEQEKPVPTETISDNLKLDVEMKDDDNKEKQSLTIPEIKVDDAEMTEQRLSEPVLPEKSEETVDKESALENKSNSNSDDQQSSLDESSSDSNSKDEPDNKLAADVQAISEDSSSSSDNTDCNSNSPRPVENHNDNAQESNPAEDKVAEELVEEEKQPQPESDQEKIPEITKEDTPVIENENYSISDVKSELPQPPSVSKTLEPTSEEPTEGEVSEENKVNVEEKTEETTIDNTSS